MSPLLKEYLNRDVVVVLTSGCVQQATLVGFDKNVNLLLWTAGQHCVRVLRGSEVVCVGLCPANTTATTGETAVDEGERYYADTKNNVPQEHLIWAQVWNRRD
ncbi:U4/U6-U5 snRNP complex subunit LSM8 KNAG_0M01280 [Huiozyma naganishii CBS 8797]|uniref:Sm domain-containing protein n=1 Tax=Huiozyma naganishii (strain ATCC MYA-139 / BCRC 22969 / CBS 8797 / KCTC 17520 / NBRC 10181 / NCYC 3082 / Yp74L-3) TaxID=1071383 RepID=J7SBE4_HUIN7|nr:hypothetical protein KNAG_0M01280 [Kazachstania naganishii CBS 8797]CCK72981.1 hypothetical protein KNAG_0M01280 [Kazachstania naganishii CBS 8797]